jgi:hypothetical protein
VRITTGEEKGAESVSQPAGHGDGKPIITDAASAGASCVRSLSYFSPG